MKTEKQEAAIIVNNVKTLMSDNSMKMRNLHEKIDKHRKELGECHKAQKEYEKLLKKYGPVAFGRKAQK